MTGSQNIDLENGKLVFTYEIDPTSKSKALLLLFLKPDSWWFNPKLGNKVYLLISKPKTALTADAVKSSLNQTLKILLDKKTVKKIEIQAENDEIDPYRINTIIQITELDGSVTEIPFTLPIH